jgi:hypothetical protein
LAVPVQASLNEGRERGGEVEIQVLPGAFDFPWRLGCEVPAER